MSSSGPSGSSGAAGSAGASGSREPSDTPGAPWSPAVVVAIADALPWRAVLLDLLIVVAWVLAVSVAFRQVDLPSWLYYVVAFGGIVAYSLVDAPWPSVGGDDVGE